MIRIPDLRSTWEWKHCRFETRRPPVTANALAALPLFHKTIFATSHWSISAFSRRSFAGDAENKGKSWASALVLHVRKPSSPIPHRLSPSACPQSQTPILTDGIACAVGHFPSWISHRTIFENRLCISASLHLLKCRTPLLLAEHMGAFNLLINTSGSQNEQRTLRTPFYPSFSIGKAFGPTFWRRMSRISLRKAWY